MKKIYLKFCDYIAKACGAFAVLALLLSILVIVELVFERYFFQRAITWQTELVTMLLVASTFIGSAYVLSEKAHVSMPSRFIEEIPDELLEEEKGFF